MVLLYNRPGADAHKPETVVQPDQFSIRHSGSLRSGVLHHRVLHNTRHCRFTGWQEVPAEGGYHEKSSFFENLNALSDMAVISVLIKHLSLKVID